MNFADQLDDMDSCLIAFLEDEAAFIYLEEQAEIEAEKKEQYDREFFKRPAWMN